MRAHPEGVPSAETKPPTSPAPETESLDERVPVGSYINPVRGLVIGLLVMAVIGLGLGLLLILQPDAPTPATGYLLKVLQPSPGAVLPGWERTFTVEFTLGTRDGAPLSDTDVAWLRVHVRSSRTSGGAGGTSTPCSYHPATKTYRCRVATPPMSAGGVETYVTVFEGPTRFMEGQQVVAPTVDASVSNPFVVRFR